MKAKDPVKGKASAAAPAPSRPFPNTYWIAPGRLLAGEYPGAPEKNDAEVRLKSLLAAGIDWFIDLTEADELSDYASLLPALDPAVRHQRFPIIDHGLPDTPAVVSEILDNIDAALAAGRRVYVHCRAGVGRTGTVLGCHLVRGGLGNEEALDRLTALWRQSERSRAIPQIPETVAQRKYVLFWDDSEVATGSAGQGSESAGRVTGALLGLAIGDAAAGESRRQWASDTAMTLVLAESLLDCSGNDLADQMQRYLRWQQEGSPAGAKNRIAVPADIRRAVATWKWTRKPYAGSHDPAQRDPGSLARTAAVALYFRDLPEVALDAATEASRTTQQAPAVLDACRLFAALVLVALEGGSKQQILSLSSGRAVTALRSRALKPEIESLLSVDWNSSGAPGRDGTAVGVLATALWAFATTMSFQDGLTLALHYSSAPATAGAVFGAIAGAHYSAAALPADLRRELADRELLEQIARRLAATPAGQG